MKPEASKPGDGDDPIPSDKRLVADAGRNLVNLYREMAPAECLTRALVAERTGHRQTAEFWIRAYFECRSLPGTAIEPTS